MPNWCFNHLTIEEHKGEKPQKILAEIISESENGEKYFDFNKIIPMPKCLEVVSGSETTRAIRYFLFTHTDLTQEERQKVLSCISEWERKQIEEDTQETINKIIEDQKDLKSFENYAQIIFDNIMLYDCPTWYEWCIKNWGTKWNSCETTIDDDEDDIVIDFDTAWSPPIPVLLALSKKYPNNVFHFECEEESDMDTAVCEFINGEIIE